MNFLNLTRKSTETDQMIKDLLGNEVAFDYIQHGSMTYDVDPVSNFRHAETMAVNMLRSGFDPRAKTYIVIDRLTVAIWWIAFLGKYGTVPDVIHEGKIIRLSDSVTNAFLIDMKRRHEEK